MALPSGVTFASIAFVAASGVGLVASQVAGADEAPTAPAPHASAQQAQPSRTPTPTPEPTQREPQPKPEPKIPQVPVEVYNNSGLSGRAGEVAGELRDQGWKVVGTDNWYGSIPTNTVYYGRGKAEAAKQLAKELDWKRVRPAVSPMSSDVLTVIIVNG